MELSKTAQTPPAMPAPPEPVNIRVGKIDKRITEAQREIAQLEGLRDAADPDAASFMASAPKIGALRELVAALKKKRASLQPALLELQAEQVAEVRRAKAKEIEDAKALMAKTSDEIDAIFTEARERAWTKIRDLQAYSRAVAFLRRDLGGGEFYEDANPWLRCGRGMNSDPLAVAAQALHFRGA